MPEAIKLDDGVYEIVPPQAVVGSKLIAETHERLGRPDTPLSDAGEKMMNVIISYWQDVYPNHYADWTQNKKDYKSVEMSPQEQARKGTGRSLASVPMIVYRLMKKVFPNYKLHNREDWNKFIRKYPIFKMTEDRV